MYFGRYAALAALLLGGACAALPFARESHPALTDAADMVEKPTVRLAVPQIVVEAGDEASSPMPPGAVAPASWHQPTPIVLPRDEAPLPMLPVAPQARTQVRESASRIHEPDFAAPQPATPFPARTPSRRKHRIADGDSLPLLALRYLGDQDRQDEILALNRDVIGDGQLLPIGREIVVPGEDGE